MNNKNNSSANVEKTKNFIFNYYNNFDFHNSKNNLISSPYSDISFLSNEYKNISFKKYKILNDIFNIFLLTTKIALITKGVFNDKDIDNISYIKDYFYGKNCYIDDEMF